MTIKAIFDASPRPMTMKRIGSSASGGTMEMAPTKGERDARAKGRIPMTRPSRSAIAVAMPSPMKSRQRLAQVSAHRRYSPVLTSAVKAIRLIASQRVAKPGSSLSFGFSASRSAEPIM
jgi:hypothetical protein